MYSPKSVFVAVVRAVEVNQVMQIALHKYKVLLSYLPKDFKSHWQGFGSITKFEEEVKGCAIHSYNAKYLIFIYLPRLVYLNYNLIGRLGNFEIWYSEFPWIIKMQCSTPKVK